MFDFFTCSLGPVTDADYVSALYDAELRYQDDLLRELDGFLATLGIQVDTLLILFGDHGESLTEHDIYWEGHGFLSECAWQACRGVRSCVTSPAHIFKNVWPRRLIALGLARLNIDWLDSTLWTGFLDG